MRRFFICVSMALLGLILLVGILVTLGYYILSPSFDAAPITTTAVIAILFVTVHATNFYIGFR